jgi:rifampicin phosphotransferase
MRRPIEAMDAQMGGWGAMLSMVKHFKEVTPELLQEAGGKGSVLAQMFQEGYPVPEGVIVFPSAFTDGILNDEAWHALQVYLRAFRKQDKEAEFAIRSSGLSEDSSDASFAGEFETVLNVKTDDEISDAIYTVYNSKQAERVKVYSSIQGIEHAHQIAVVIQVMVQSALSGVLFTADPITGSHAKMIGNFVHGLGEQLVSGEADADSFTLKRPSGKYNGPNELKKFASSLYKLASKLEKRYAGPEDIEWAVADGKLYILQARPITTVKPGNLDTYEWNDSLTGDFLWTNTNVGEAMSDVFTPVSWSIIRALDEEQMTVPGYYLFSGNICGRAYTNISLGLSFLSMFGMSTERGLKLMGEVFGQMPEGIQIPLYPFSRLRLIKELAPRIKHRLKKVTGATRTLQKHVQETPEWCRKMADRIREVKTENELCILWENEILPYNFKSLWVTLAGGRKMMIVQKLKAKLIELAGTEDANTLLSNFRGNSALESLGPVIGISKILNGEMSREEYLIQYGHRGPHEFELSIPHPGEDKAWLEEQIREFETSHIDVGKLLKKQKAQYDEAWKRLEIRHPGKVSWVRNKLEKAGAAARQRESVRSEWTRVFRVNRAFAIKASELTGIGDDIFFLYIHEVLQLLSGDDTALKHIPARKENYEKYKALPPLPAVIRGRFDPFRFALDPKRRVDYYDPALSVIEPDARTLTGVAGAAGRVEGSVRILINPDEGDKLQPGEILVASTTNVGWTPLFPKASAIITDIGAPLSHAAIVARELGIPAVVGCGNATTRLKNGDKVVVDGGHGIVQILNE